MNREFRRQFYLAVVLMIRDFNDAAIDQLLSVQYREVFNSIRSGSTRYLLTADVLSDAIADSLGEELARRKCSYVVLQSIEMCAESLLIYSKQLRILPLDEERISDLRVFVIRMLSSIIRMYQQAIYGGFLIELSKIASTIKNSIGLSGHQLPDIDEYSDGSKNIQEELRAYDLQKFLCGFTVGFARVQQLIGRLSKSDAFTIPMGFDFIPPHEHDWNVGQMRTALTNYVDVGRNAELLGRLKIYRMNGESVEIGSNWNLEYYLAMALVTEWILGSLNATDLDADTGVNRDYYMATASALTMIYKKFDLAKEMLRIEDVSAAWGRMGSLKERLKTVHHCEVDGG